ncbi:hypothetical protein EVB67_032 [Rhizobium phage RHph_TM3_3_14B]|nr:hypothetical protein EVB67_032 [Rhizobium phage RHph_TM3_3_14B]
MTFRDFIKDLIGAASAGSFVWAVAIWLPYVAQHH